MQQQTVAVGPTIRSQLVSNNSTARNTSTGSSPAQTAVASTFKTALNPSSEHSPVAAPTTVACVPINRSSTSHYWNARVDTSGTLFVSDIQNLLIHAMESSPFETRPRYVFGLSDFFLPCNFQAKLLFRNYELIWFRFNCSTVPLGGAKWSAQTTCTPSWSSFWTASAAKITSRTPSASKGSTTSSLM